MRGGIFAAETARGRGARADRAPSPRWRAPTSPGRSPRRSRSSSTGDGPHVVGIDTGIKLSIVRQLRERGCRVTLLPCDAARRGGARRTTPTSSSSPTAPATRRRSTTSSTRSASWSASGRSSASASATSCSAGRSASRPSSCPFGHRGANHPVKDLATRQDRDHLPEPRLRGRRPGRRDAHRGRRAGPLGDRLRRRRALPPEPLRPHGRGPGAARRARRHGPVPPRGRPRARTTPATSSTASWSWRAPDA